MHMSQFDSCKTQFGVRKTGFIIQSSFFSVYMLTFLTEGQLCSRCLIPLPVKHQPTVIRMNKVILFNQHKAALTVSPVVLRICLLLYFNH